MPLSKEEIVRLYRKRARRYDFTANLYYLIGFREWAYRKKAVAALKLKPGDTVVEVGCGTGLNFSLLQNSVGVSGKIIGIDLTDQMLVQASERVTTEGWTNVELVHTDAASYQFPTRINGIISTFALTLVPEFDEVIRKGAEALAPGGRWVVADLKMADKWPEALSPILEPLVRPFGVELDLASRHPWESMQNYLRNVTVKEFFWGFTYIAVGEAV